MPFTYDYPHMAVTVDAVLFELTDPPRVLLIERGHEPFKGKWAIPGGYVEMDEQVHVAAERELAEETGVEGIALTFLGYFDGVDRDPRERTLSLAFWGTVPPNSVAITASDDACDARWRSILELPELAFDHQLILERAIDAFTRRER